MGKLSPNIRPSAVGALAADQNLALPGGGLEAVPQTPPGRAYHRPMPRLLRVKLDPDPDNSLEVGPDGLYAPPGGGGSGAVFVAGSLDGDGTAPDPLTLVNDNATPGANRVYGTDAAGAKGYKLDPQTPYPGFTVGAVDGNGPILPTNVVFWKQVGRDWTLAGNWKLRVLPDPSSVTVDMRLATFPTIPVLGDSITGGNSPAVSAAGSATGNYTGWTDLTLARGQIIAAVITGNTGCRYIDLILEAT